MGKVAYIFPGQGSQYSGMGLELYQKYASAKAVFDQADEALGFSISELCFEGSEEELKKTVNAQPALLTMSIACLEAAKEELGENLPAADYMAGHSLGEYTALAASQSIAFSDAVRLAHMRGQYMYDAGQKIPGTMAAVIGMDKEKVEQICKETGAYVANYNCPGQIAISGGKSEIREAKKRAKDAGAKLVLPLQVSGAFHSPLIREAADMLEPQIMNCDISAPEVPVISNTSVQVLDSREKIQEELKIQVCHSVRWEETIRYLLEQGVTTFIEFGPGHVLTGLLKRIDSGASAVNVGTVEEIQKITEHMV